MDWGVVMLAELVGWYAGREENRRRYPRLKRDYEAQWSLDAGHSWRPLKGVDVSGGGMCANSEREIPNVIVDIAMTLQGKNVRLKAQPMWHTDVSQGNKRAICYGFQFTSVGGDDWDAIMQWITGSDSPEMANMPQARIEESEVAHLVPRELREKLLNELVKRYRFDRKDVTDRAVRLRRDHARERSPYAQADDSHENESGGGRRDTLFDALPM